MKPRAIARPRPDPPPLGRARGAVERLEDPLAQVLRDAGTAVDHPHHQPRPDQPRAHQHRLPLAVDDRVLQQVGEGALELGRVGAQRRQVVVERRGAPAHRAGRSIRAPRPAGRPARPARGAARPCPIRAARRRAGSPPAARAAAPRRPPRRSARGARSAVTLGESSAAPAAMIAVSGVRRSWDTERSSEVFSSSERRTASASIASSRIRSRSAASAAASSQRPVGLLAPALRLGGPRPRQLGQGAAGDRDDDEDDQGDDVVLGVDRERAQRRQVEEVEDERAERPRCRSPSRVPRRWRSAAPRG